jgi:hypothetical protein
MICKEKCPKLDHEKVKCCLRRAKGCLDQVYRLQFDVEMPHALKEQIAMVDLEIDRLIKLAGFVYKSEGVIR